MENKLESCQFLQPTRRAWLSQKASTNGGRAAYKLPYRLPSRAISGDCHLHGHHVPQPASNNDNAPLHHGIRYGDELCRLLKTRLWQIRQNFKSSNNSKTKFWLNSLTFREVRIGMATSCQASQTLQVKRLGLNRMMTNFAHLVEVL